MAPTGMQTKYWDFKGGLDIVTPPLKVDPGSLLGCQNYEIGIHGGYGRIEGYERYSGQAKPSDASYWILDFDAGDTEVTAGQTVTGGTSGATGIATLDGVLESGSYAGSDAAGYLVLFGVTGTFQDNESLEVSSTGVAASAGTASERDASTDILDTTYYLAAIEATRDLIAAVPGSGAIRGVWIYDDVRYAFRDNAAGTEGIMYKSTASGWAACSLGANTLNPGGSYEFVNYNFTGHSGTLKMYGVSGEDKAFQWDGTTFTFITTGMAVDKPTHITAKDYQLILSFTGGNLQASAIGDPTSWTLLTGADQVGVGDEITGFAIAAGNVLAVFSRNSTHILTGQGSSNWKMLDHSRVSGAISGSIQRMQGTIYLDDRGLTALTQTQDFGDFQDNTLSKKIQPRFDSQKTKVTVSTMIKSKNQYIIFFNDNTAVGE